MKKVLVLYYSQSGQLKSVMDHIVAPLSQYFLRQPILTAVLWKNLKLRTGRRVTTIDALADFIQPE